MNLSSLFSPVVTFLQSAALKLSMLDGKPGLTADDFTVVVGWVRDTEYNNQDKGPKKHRAVADLVTEAFGDRISPTYRWVIDVIVWVAYNVAQRKGLIAA